MRGRESVNECMYTCIIINMSLHAHVHVCEREKKTRMQGLNGQIC